MDFASNTKVGVGIGIAGVLACCMFKFLKQKYDLDNDNSDDSGSDSENEISSERDYKMVLLIRKDLNMQKGKAAAQCAHAAVAAYKIALKQHKKELKLWERNGQPKITLKIDSEEELLDLTKKARKAGLIAIYICDAGRTQVDRGSKTVCAIGPGPVDLIDEITGHLKLY